MRWIITAIEMKLITAVCTTQAASLAAVQALQICREAGIPIFHLTSARMWDSRTENAGTEGDSGISGTLGEPVALQMLRPFEVILTCFIVESSENGTMLRYTCLACRQCMVCSTHTHGVQYCP